MCIYIFQEALQTFKDKKFNALYRTGHNLMGHEIIQILKGFCGDIKTSTDIESEV